MSLPVCRRVFAAKCFWDPEVHHLLSRLLSVPRFSVQTCREQVFKYAQCFSSTASVDDIWTLRFIICCLILLSIPMISVQTCREQVFKYAQCFSSNASLDGP